MALLGGVALLEWIWLYWRKCASVGVSLEISYAQNTVQCPIQLLIACKM